jgi:hypothetical protein
MDKESWRSGGDPRPDPRGETSFNELAKGLANGTISRRQALRWMGGALAGAAFASVPGVAFAAPEGNSACDAFCHANFSGRAAGECTSAGAHGTGPCYTCTPGIGPGPNFTPPQCGTNEVFNPQTCACACAEGFETCQGACVPVCPPDTLRNPETCLCERPCETFVCGEPLCVGDVTLPVNERCACFEVTETPGQGTCLGDFFCLDAVACPNGTSDCPTGFTCVTNTCCGEGVQLCAPECSVGGTTVRVSSEGGGPTASGA